MPRFNGKEVPWFNVTLMISVVGLLFSSGVLYNRIEAAEKAVQGIGEIKKDVSAVDAAVQRLDERTMAKFS